jgi:hypothetical protein
MFHVREFRDKKTKEKLIKFLHATNLEFIERSILIKDYFERRQKRLILKIFGSYAKHAKCPLNVNKIPLYYYYYASLWLGKAKQVSLPRPFHRNHSKRYAKQHKLANKML